VEAAKAKVQRLLDAGFIREVTYLEWLANVIMVKKKNGKWWMCTNFTDLNKCCPKDDFPLARIDQIIDFATASEMMVLLDCFFGYHQIWLRTEDKEKTSFITPFGTYCYLRMSEGLRQLLWSPWKGCTSEHRWLVTYGAPTKLPHTPQYCWCTCRLHC
jgi:hypothetical protein